MAVLKEQGPFSPPAEPPEEPEPEPYSIFDSRQKAFIVFMISVAATFSGFASNIYFPALPTIAADLHVSVELISLTITSYLIFQGLAPSLWGPISDAKGRRVAYCCTFVVFLGACIGLALSRSYAALIVLRMLQSTGSASTIAIGSGVIGDITTRAERGGWMGIFQAGLLSPVAIGPIIGGALAGSLGWPSIFWFLAIYSGAFLVCLIFFLPETLRPLVGNGGLMPRRRLARFPLNWYQRSTKIRYKRRDRDASPLTGAVPSTLPVAAAAVATARVDILAPLRILLSKQGGPVVFFLAIHYAIWQMSLTAMSSLFASDYGLAETQIGLTFIANGVGSIIGTLVTGKLLDVEYARVQRQYEAQRDAAAAAAAAVAATASAGLPQPPDNYDDGFPLERARLRLAPLFSLLQCASILTFGWTLRYAQRGVPIAAPIVTTFFSGWAVVSLQSVAATYLVDVYHMAKTKASTGGRSGGASAGACLNLARCLCAAAGTSFVMPLVHTIGTGWAFTACVGVQLAALGLLVVQWHRGAAWRREAAAAAEKAEERDS